MLPYYIKEGGARLPRAQSSAFLFLFSGVAQPSLLFSVFCSPFSLFLR